MAFKWKHCAISQEALVKPIVACELGRLYNKETVLEFLLDKSKFEQASGFEHIKGLKDVKELKLTDNPARRPDDPKKGGGSFIDTSVADYICPVSGLEMSGRFRFCFIWSCGCALSERAYREVKSDTCQKCGKGYRKDDVIVLNGTDDEVEYFIGRMIERRALARALKKAKKASKNKCSDKEEAGPSKKPHLEAGSSSSSTPSPPPVNGTGKGQTEPKLIGQSERRSKILSGIGKGAKLTKNGKLSTEKSSNGKAEKVSGIQDNPKNSKTFKALFTTSEAEKLQEKPHWITYNPLYY